MLFLRDLTDRVYVDRSIKQYIVALVNTTRGGGPRPLPELHQHVRVGASPARRHRPHARAPRRWRCRRAAPTSCPTTSSRVRHPVLRHRLVRTYDALANNVAPEAIIDAVFQAVPAP